MGPDAPPVQLIEQPAVAYCVVSASHRYDLPIEGLLSILMTEGGKPGSSSKNDNGTSDLGVMQINTVWLKPQSPLYGYVTAETLKNDLCVNIHAAAWIVAVNVKKVGDIWRAVGRYHSPGNSTLAWAYMNRVNQKLPAAREVVQTSPVYLRNIQAFFKNSAELAAKEAAHAAPGAGASFALGSEFKAVFPTSDATN